VIANPAAVGEGAPAPAFYTVTNPGSSTSAPASFAKERAMGTESSFRLRLPSGGAARLFSLPTAADCHWCVILAGDPERARLESRRRPGGLAALVTHDPGGTWPDRKGEAMAMAVLARGGAVGLAFASIADALACKRRLEGEAPR
jgi:hypothetical protein